MKITKAIEILEDIDHTGYLKFRPDFPDAIKLGIEALKHFKYHRDLNIISFVKQLPGEDPPVDSSRSLHHIKEVLESPLGREPQ